MLNLNPVTSNKTKEPSQGRVVSPQQKINFDALLLEFKLKQLDALGGFMGGENESQSDPLAGYRGLLMNSLAGKPGMGLGAKTEVVLKQYQADAVSANQGSKTSILDLVHSTAKKYNIPEQWFEKLIRQESAFDPSAVSPKGAMGLGQLMPATARELGLRIGTDREEGSVWNPASNLSAAARYLRQLHDRYADMGMEENEVWTFAAGAYNAGMGNIQKALDRLDDATPSWARVAGVLPDVTGHASRETLRYVNNLQA